MAVITTLPSLPDYAAAAHAQTARRELADAVDTRTFLRELFEGWPSDENAEAVRIAEDRCERALMMLGEWTS